MLTVGWTVELGLDVDARCGGKGEAMAHMDVSLGWRCERRRLRVDGSRVSGLHSGMGDLADGLLELGQGNGLGFGKAA